MNTIHDLPEILDVEQVSGWLGKHPNTIRNWAKLEYLPSKKIGPYWHFHRDTLIKFFDDTALAEE